MPIIYLSPSTQEGNRYVTGTGSEEQWMNRLADAMIPYLAASGIRYTRNTPQMTAGSSIRQANQGYYDFYLALHSNAAGPGNYGGERGVIAFYYPGSSGGQRAAQIFANNLEDIYPEPSRVYTRTTTTLGEVRDSRAPAVLLEIAYHDNTEDARWIENNITAIAQNLVLSLTDYFDIPFIWPTTPWQGTVRTNGQNLNLRSRPEDDAYIITRIPDGARVTVYGAYEEWYVVRYGDFTGYAAGQFIS